MRQARPQATTLVALLRQRATERSDQVAYLELTPDGEVRDTRTYGEIDRAARCVAARLETAAGSRALLLYPHGIEFITAFFGCLYAGVIAVPAYPPRNARSLPRLQAIARDARPRFLLSTEALLARRDAWLDRAPELAALRSVATDRTDGTGPEEWREPGVDGDWPAFLQYTSGSTSTPKGVRILHRNLLHNEEMIRRAFDQSEDSVIVSWLPLYHDMGLIGGVLQPLYAGARCVLLSPGSFLQKPSRWLRAISEHRGTTSGGPNFAYELCVDKISPDEVEGLDLSSWRVAFNGAEPVHGATLDRFSRAFEPAGFERRAFYPCYGLAEATLFVSGGRVEEAPVLLPVEARELRIGRVVEAPDGLPLVSSGTTWLGQDVRVVDPESATPLDEGWVGEIWVRGPSVADGYWRREGESAYAFGASLAGDTGAGGWLRTGDLGFLRGRELFVTGRLKDLVIVHGRNHYPQDLERSAGQAHPALRRGAAAAFTVGETGIDRLVVVQEVKARHRKARDELEAAVAAARRAIAEENEIAVHEVVLVSAGQVPRTTSGKVRRSACREAYLQGDLDVLARSGAGGSIGPGEAREDPRATERPPEELWSGTGAADRERRTELLASRLKREIARLAGVEAWKVDLEQPLPALGVDSLGAIEIGHLLETVSGVPLDPLGLLGKPSVSTLIQELVDSSEDRPENATAEPPPGRSRGTGGAVPLTTRHRSLLYQEELPGAGSLHHLVGLARVRGRLDRGAFRRAVDSVVGRHPGLAARLDRSGGAPVFRASSEGAEVLFLDAEEPEPALVDRLQTEARRPYDLARESPLRVWVARVRDDEHLVLLVVHHLAADFWSIAQVVHELGGFYRAERAGAPIDPPRRSDWDELAVVLEREEQELEGPVGESLRAYWRSRFTEAPPPLDLPVSGPRPAVRTASAGSVQRLLPAADLESASQAAARQGVTLFAWLLAAFQALLARYSGSEAVLAVPTAGRAESSSRDLVGYLVQVVPVRSDLADDPPFAQLAARVAREVLEATQHAGYPLARIVEDAGLPREPSRPPLTQVLFSFQSPPPGAPPGLEAFALGLPGGRFRLDELEVESLPVQRCASGFELELEVARVGDRLAARLVFDRDLFECSTAERLLGHYEVLLAHASRSPGHPVSRLRLLTRRERAAVALEWNDTGCDGPRDPAGGVPAQLWDRIARGPDAVAVTWEGEQLSYGDLGRRADRLARGLGAMGVGPELPVGVLLERSSDLLVTLLAVWRAGGAYVPLDPAYPEERLAMMIEDAGLRCLVTTTDLARRVSGDRPPTVLLDAREEDPEPGVSGGPPAAPVGGQLAYVIYTSGSTGRPKGVQVSHGALANFVRAMARRPGLAAGESLLAVTTVSFDIAALELFVPLVQGGRVVLLPGGQGRDPAVLASILDRERIDVMQATPATWKLLLADGWRGRPGLRILCGGEALPPSLADGLMAAGDEVWNLYGPTETTVWSSHERLALPGGEVRVGRPIEETRIVALDRHLEPVPPKVPGEVWIGGTGVARGYRFRPGPTAERFVPDPFSRRPGGRLYRTGDLGRVGVDGRLELLGRIDHQVKVRGFRVEPGEIEEELRRHPSVREAVVVARGESGEARLAAFVVPAQAGEIDPDALRRALARSLPAHMVPATYVELDELPLTPNGKVDRNRLPRDRPEAAPSRTGSAATPETPVEEILTRLWSEVLGVGNAGADDDFFALGGHSLDATRLVHGAREALGRDVALHRLLENPTPRALAACLAAEETPAPPPIPRLGDAEAEAGVPLSFAQERVWLFQRLHPGSSAYSLPVEIRIDGPLAAASLDRAFVTLARRHQALRATPEADQPVQRLGGVPPRGAPLTVRRLDLTGLPKTVGRAAARGIARRVARRPFALGSERPLRACLLRLGPREHRLVVVAHHVVADGGSMDLFLRELTELVRSDAAGGTPELPRVQCGLLDFAAWQRQRWTGESLSAAAGSFPETEAHLELPTDRPRPGVQRFRGAVAEVALDPELPGALEALCRRESVTPFMALLAAFQLFLGRVSGVRAVTVGAPFEQRDRPELRDAIGFFVNLLPLSLRWEETTTVSGLLAAARASVLDGFRHRGVPFEAVAASRRAGGRAEPEIRATFSMEPHRPPVVRDGISWDPKPIDNGTAKFDLGLLVRPGGAAWRLRWEYDRDLFDATTAQRWSAGFKRWLETFLSAHGASPVAELPYLAPAERAQVLSEWAEAPAPAAPPVPVHRRVLLQAEDRCDAVAAVAGGDHLTYSELARRSGRWARFLVERGVGADSAVGLLANRTLERLVGSLAVLRAGGAYLPLDPANPPSRAASMLRDAGAVAVLVEPELATGAVTEAVDRQGGAALLTTEPPEVSTGEHDAPLPAEAAHLAYIVFTSGSTGVPKGVTIEHRGLDQLVSWHREAYGVTTDDRASAVSGLGFDASVWEVWPPLAAGATLELAPEGVLGNPGELARWMDRRRVTLAFLPTPVAEAVLAELGGVPASLRHLLTGGDRLHEVEAELPPRVLFNHYGPSECSVVATCAPVESGPSVGPPPIGRLLPGLTGHVTDPYGRLVPPRTAGELVLGGSGLARGYANRPALTAERFVPNAFGPPGSRLYRTGDLVRYRREGTLDFLGRTDHQVEIRGHRVEPGEVEAVLGRHPSVERVAVVAVGEQGIRLAAYVVPSGGDGFDPDDLARFAASRLPAYMIPASVTVLERLPLTANGKVDRRGLPAPGRTTEYVGPRNEVEQIVVELWQELLEVERVGIRDRFFELGGHSLQAVQVASRLGEEFGVDLPVGAVLQSPTPEELALDVVRALVAGSGEAEVEEALAAMDAEV